MRIFLSAEGVPRHAKGFNFSSLFEEKELLDGPTLPVFFAVEPLASGSFRKIVSKAHCLAGFNQELLNFWSVP